MAFYLDATIRPASQKGAFVDYLDAPPWTRSSP
jgi:hypothetical protein